MEWQGVLDDIGFQRRMGAFQVEASGCLVEAAWKTEFSVLALNVAAAFSAALRVTSEIKASLGAMAVDPDHDASAPQRP